MPKTLTILHLVSLRGMGGRAATALRQARLLSARGHKVLVGCLAGSKMETRARDLKLPVFSEFEFRSGFHPWSFWRDCRRIAALCNEHHVDVLHAHISQDSWVGCIGARLARRRPAIVRSRGVVVPVKPHPLNRFLHNRLTDALVVPSKVIGDGLRRLPAFDPAKIELLPDGVDIVRFAPRSDGAGVRDEFKLPEGCALILMVARLERVKGHRVFFEALARLAKNPRTPPFRALCACDARIAGSMEKTLAAAREAGLTEDVLRFTGFRQDVERVIAAADMVVLPSLGSEGSSRVALESAACGVPVVASAVGCLPEVVPDGEAGVIVPPDDPEALAGGLLKMLQDPARGKELGRTARRRAEQLYDERRMVEHLERVYLQAAARHGLAPQEEPAR